LTTTIIALVCVLLTTKRALNRARELNSHRGTFDSIERLHRKVREDNNLQDGEVEFLYKFNGRTFDVGVIGVIDGWFQNGSREIVLTYSENGQTYLLKDRRPKNKTTVILNLKGRHYETE